MSLSSIGGPEAARPMRLEALAQFMRFLSDMPDPARVALARGPLSVFGALSTRVTVAVDNRLLVTVSHYGYTATEANSFRETMLVLDVPFSRAYRDCAVIRADTGTGALDTPAQALEADLWSSMVSRLGLRTIVAAPIVNQGASIGVFGFGLPQVPDWQEVDLAYIDVVSSVLGMWMTHPHNGLPERYDLSRTDSDPSFSLTARQLTVLQFVSEGASNQSIASNLGYSLSTVRAEMRVIHRVLRTRDRTSAVARARDLSLLPPRPDSPNVPDRKR